VTVHGIARKVVAAFVIGLSLAWVVWTIGGLNFSDADAYRLAADRLVAGEDIYVQAPNQDEAFRYAPWFAVAWIPLAALPEALGDVLWAAILSVATVFSVLPLARQPYLVARLLAIFGGAMLIWTVARGNVHPLVMVALIQGLDRRSGPLWVALAASLKAVPIFFVLIYVARREWWRAATTVGITALLVLPMPFMGWEPGTVDPGESLSLYYLVSPAAWLVVAAAAAIAAIGFSYGRSRFSAVAAAVAAIAALPRLLLYDITYVLVSAHNQDVSRRPD
jgi:hypothetical protein